LKPMRRALLNYCAWCLSRQQERCASMNSVLVTIAPAMDAFTSMYSPARSAVRAMTSSSGFPSVAVEQTPTASRSCRDELRSVAQQALRRHDSEDGKQKSRAAIRSGNAQLRHYGTNTSSHSSGLRRISFRSRFMTASSLLSFLTMKKNR